MILKTITCNDPKPTASTNPIATPMFSRSRSKLQGMKRNILIPQTAKMFPCSKQHAMIRHIITPTLFLMKVFVKKSGAATIRRIKTAGNSSQSEKCLGNKRCNTIAMKAIHFPKSVLMMRKIKEGRLKKMNGMSSDVRMSVFQFARSNISK